MATLLPIQNSSKRNTLKITIHDAVRDEKSGKIVPNKWKKGSHTFLAPNATQDVWLDTGRGVFLEEMPS
jgi:hypothetical protein